MSGEPRLHPDRLGRVPRTGAVGSVQTAELDVGGRVGRVMTRSFLEHAAAEYWRVITRFTLGLVGDDGEVIHPLNDAHAFPLSVCSRSVWIRQRRLATLFTVMKSLRKRASQALLDNLMRAIPLTMRSAATIRRMPRAVAAVCAASATSCSRGASEVG